MAERTTERASKYARVVVAVAAEAGRLHSSAFAHLISMNLPQRLLEWFDMSFESSSLLSVNPSLWAGIPCFDVHQAMLAEGDGAAWPAFVGAGLGAGDGLHLSPSGQV